jgi:rubrerythrin
MLHLVLDTLDHAVRRAIFSQPRAKAFALSSYAAAEASGEGKVFVRAMERVQDTRLRRLLQQHEADELRHAHILSMRRDELGLPEHAIPEHLDLVERLSNEAGGLLRREMRCDEDVADAFTLLYVIEERALDEFRRAAEALRETGDEGTAALFDSISRDERRHLRYCETIATRHGPGFDVRLARMRELERRVYGKQTRDWTWHLLSSGLLSLPVVLGAVVRASLSLANRLALPAPEPVLATA